MPGSPRIVISSGARSATTRANVSRRRPSSSLAPDQRPVEPAPDRRSVGVEVVAAGSRRRAAPRRGRRGARGARSTRRSGSHPPRLRRASRSASATASPITAARRASRAERRRRRCRRRSARRMPNGTSSAPRARARRPRAAPAARRPRARPGMPKTASTASLRSSASVAAVARAHRPRRVVVALEHRAQRLRVEPVARRGRQSCENRQVTRRRASGAADRPAGRRGRRGRVLGTSWRRIAASSARSSGDGSMPSPSTSASCALR